MRKLLLLPMLFLAMALASCSDDNSPTTTKTNKVTFNVATPQLPTRAVNITRYIMAIYTLDDPGTVLHRIEQASGTFTLDLGNNTSYVCLFWADETAPDNNAGGTYDASDLKNVTLNDGKDMADAFFARLNITTDETTFYVTLKRPIAQVNIVETGSIEANSHIVITHDHYNSFNTFTSDVVESPVSKSITITPTETTGKLGSYYTFAPVAGHLKDFTAVYNSSTTNQIPNVPLKANFITNINGHYTDGNQDFTFIIEIDDVWEGDDPDGAFASGVAINIGTSAAPNWIEFADRNAEKDGPDGGTEGSSSIDYGDFYTWTSTNYNPTDIDGAYSACFNFMQGNGTWRVPTTSEWTSLSADGTDGSRRVKSVDGEWKLYDERAGKENEFIYFPTPGYLSPGSSSLNNPGVSAIFWASNNSYFFHMYGNNTGSSSIGSDYLLSVRCVREIDPPT